jgi:hypothetical protein
MLLTALLVLTVKNVQCSHSLPGVSPCSLEGILIKAKQLLDAESVILDHGQILKSAN